MVKNPGAKDPGNSSGLSCWQAKPQATGHFFASSAMSRTVSGVQGARLHGGKAPPLEPPHQGSKDGSAMDAPNWAVPPNPPTRKLGTEYQIYIYIIYVFPTLACGVFVFPHLPGEGC